MATLGLNSRGEQLEAFNRSLLIRGSVMVALSALVIQLVVVFYLITELGIFSEQNHLLIAISGLVYLLAVGLLLLARFRVANTHLLYLSALLLTFAWCLLAMVVNEVWHEVEAAKRLLLIAFFIIFLAWYPRTSLVVITLPWVIASYAYIEYSSVNVSLLDHVLSLVKFPLFVVIFYATVGQLFHRAQRSYQENLALVDQLRKSARTDALTNIGNRLQFNEDLGYAINASMRLETPMTLVILDIDFFKQYNDMLGHPEGDKCLQKVATLFEKHCQRAVDSVARIGGEEFAFILTGSSLKQAATFIARVQAELNTQAIMHPGSKISSYVTVSAGIAQCERDDVESLYKKADHALYRAKKAGRNCCISAPFNGH
ncbi:MAG: GGDEF domain-containing protein, partial [Pseudomonadales bacterium]